MKDISGEEIPLDDSQYVYQDMCVKPGEMYGNTIAIDLPDMARKLFVEINKVIFEDEEIWKASEAQKCVSFVPEEIVPPKNNFERIQDELSKEINHVEYVKYYYQENESAWLCTCGKVNDINHESCSFCNTLRNAEKELLTKDNFKSFCASVDEMVEEEKRIEAEKKKAEIYAEAKQRETEREAEEQERLQRELEEDQNSHKRNIRTAIILVIIAVIIAGAIVAGILISGTTESSSVKTDALVTSKIQLNGQETWDTISDEIDYMGEIIDAFSDFMDSVNENSVTIDEIHSYEEYWDEIRSEVESHINDLDSKTPDEAFENAWNSLYAFLDDYMTAAELLSDWDTNGDGAYSASEISERLTEASSQIKNSSKNLESMEEELEKFN